MKTVRYQTRKHKITCSSILQLLLLFQPATLIAKAGGGEHFQPVLREEPSLGGGDLPVVYIESVADALHQVAMDANVALCLAHGATDPAFDSTCSTDVGKRDEIYRLRWNVDLNVTQIHESRRMVIVTLSLDVYGVKKPKKKAQLVPPPKNLIQQVEVFTPADYPAARREELIGAAIYDTIVHNTQIKGWFDNLAEFESLLLPRPPGLFPPPPISRYAEIEQEPSPPEITPEQLDLWRAEKDRIADLLIADQVIEARESAAALLQEEGLPDDIARRVKELHDIAVEKAAVEAETVEPPPPEDRPKPLDVMFEVRFAPTGSGFRSGIDGKLYISYRDIRFVPNDSQQDDGWSVKWPALGGFGKADGVWDVANPLFIETMSGESYFITEKMKNGRYGTGERILEYINRGRRSIRGGGET